ncbi:MAG: transposase [Anaerolineae bacterium]|nr:transposase [Anaerolineae bacterium]MCB9104200.1 transposase [Anaerolineales bacterium]
MDQKLLDLYSDYVITSFSLATATGLSSVVDNAYSHDQITRFLGKERYDQKRYWQTIKPTVRQVERADGVVLVDDTIEEKPYTEENDIVCYHYDHSQERTVKGINLVNFVYHTILDDEQSISLPVAFELVAKTDVVQDLKSGKYKRKSPVSKNELVRERLKILVQHNRLKFKYVIWDSWFSAKDNMVTVKQKLKKDFVGTLKGNRLVALSEADKRAGQFVAVSEVELKAGQCRLVYLKGVAFHKSLKQNVALEKSPTKTIRSQSNHIFAAMIAFIKLERLKLAHQSNHFALKSKLYLKAVKAAFSELKALSCHSVALVNFSSA